MVVFLPSNKNASFQQNFLFLSPPLFTLLSSLVPSFTHSHSFMLSLPRSPFLLFALRSFFDSSRRHFSSVHHSSFFQDAEVLSEGIWVEPSACPRSFITFTVKNVPQLFIYALFDRERYNSCPSQVLVFTADANLSTLSWKSFYENKKSKQWNKKKTVKFLHCILTNKNKTGLRLLKMVKFATCHMGRGTVTARQESC